MATIIQQRRGTAAEWTAANTILANGEKGLETDGLGTSEVKEKIGNGVLAWNNLPYQETGAVKSVSGDGVDNTDPKNPVLSFPDTSEVAETTDKKYVTDAEKVVIGNTSGTNTGDQDISGLQPILSEGAFVDGDKTKLDNQSGTNTGDETTGTIQAKRPIKTVNSQSLEGSGNIEIIGGESVSLQLPTQIEAVVGDTIQIFYQAMLSTPNYDNYHFVGKSSVSPTESKSLPRYFETTATTAGDRLLTFYVLGSNYEILDEKTTVLKVLPPVSSPANLVSVWNIGDSFINNPTSNDELERRLTGTGGTPVGNEFTNIEIHREGNSGREWNWYVNDEASPFVYSGVLDFEQYRIDNALNVPTVALLNLTWNGVGIERNDAEWITWTNDVYTFIDTIKVQFPNIDVKFVSPSMPSTLGGESVAGGAYGLENYGDEYLLKVNLLRMALIYERIKGEIGYSDYVQHIQSSLQVDSVYNVGSDATPVNTRNSSVTEQIGNNNVHPTTDGYYQISDAQYRNFIVNYCQTVLGNFKLSFNNTFNERLSTPNIDISGDYTISLDVNSFLDNNTQCLIGGITTQIILFSSGRIYFKSNAGVLYLSTTGILPSTGQYNFKISRVGSTVSFYVDNVLVDSTTDTGNVGITWVGNQGSNWFSGEIDNLVIDSETFSFSEGSGSITQGSLGTVFTLESTNNVEDMWIPE